MNHKIKEFLENMYLTCDVLDENNIGARACDVDCDTRTMMEFNLLRYLMYLSASDGSVNIHESRVIADYLDWDLDVESIIEHIEDEGLDDEDFAFQPPSVMALFVNADNTLFEAVGANESPSSQLLLSLYEYLGKELLASDADVTFEEIERFTLYLTSLKDYIEENLTFYHKITFDNNIEFTVTSDQEESYNEIQLEQYETEEEPVAEPEETLEMLLDELNSLTGLAEVKKDVNSLINLMQIKKIREERGMKQIPMSMHLVFSGNPGTGKTTVARLLAKIYHKLGVLSKGHLVEVDRSGLVGGYVGQTAIKVQEVLQKALGGVLFIDEAYALTSNRGESDYGQEAVDTILKGMEDNRDDLIIIVAGYPDLMDEFLNSNPGLRSRFNKFIYFEDYNPAELLDIFKGQCKRAGYTIDAGCEEYVREFFEQRYATRDENYANGRDVRNYFEVAVVNQANRLAQLSDISNADLELLTFSDVENISLTH